MKLFLRVVLIIVGLLCLAVAAPFIAALFSQQADRTAAAPASGRIVHAYDVNVTFKNGEACRDRSSC